VINDNYQLMVNNSVMNDLHLRIKAARKRARVTQEMVGLACDPPISKAAVSRWESEDPEKRSKPELDNLRTLARLTNTPISEFIPDENKFAREESAEYTAKYIVDTNIKELVAAFIDNNMKDLFSNMPTTRKIDIIMVLLEAFKDDAMKQAEPATVIQLLQLNR